MTVDVEALSALYLGPIEPTTPPWMARQRVDRLAAALHGASRADVTKGYERALSTLGDAELVAQAFAAIWPQPQLSTRAPAAEAASAAPAGALSTLAERVLGVLPAAAARAAAEGRPLSRRHVHRPLQRHCDTAELEAALAELEHRGYVRVVGEGPRASIELVQP